MSMWSFRSTTVNLALPVVVLKRSQGSLGGQSLRWVQDASGLGGRPWETLCRSWKSSLAKSKQNFQFLSGEIVIHKPHWASPTSLEAPHTSFLTTLPLHSGVENPVTGKAASLVPQDHIFNGVHHWLNTLEKGKRWDTGIELRLAVGESSSISSCHKSLEGPAVVRSTSNVTLLSQLDLATVI